MNRSYLCLFVSVYFSVCPAYRPSWPLLWDRDAKRRWWRGCQEELWCVQSKNNSNIVFVLFVTILKRRANDSELLNPQFIVQYSLHRPSQDVCCLFIQVVTIRKFSIDDIFVDTVFFFIYATIIITMFWQLPTMEIETDLIIWWRA